MEARCPECEKVADLDLESFLVKCPHCTYESDYDKYLEIMTDQAVNMAADYIPDRPGF